MHVLNFDQNFLNNIFNSFKRSKPKTMYKFRNPFAVHDTLPDGFLTVPDNFCDSSNCSIDDSTKLK